MKVNVRGVHLELTEALKSHVEAHLVEPIRRFYNPDAAELEIHLRDNNGPKGGVDKECSLTLRVPRGQPVHISETSEDIYKSIDLARDRLERSVRRQVERSLDRRREESPTDLTPIR